MLFTHIRVPRVADHIHQELPNTEILNKNVEMVLQQSSLDDWLSVDEKTGP